MNMSQVKKWVQDAVIDGWEIKPTYEKTESVEQAASLTKDGFKILALMRPAGTDYGYMKLKKDEVSLHAWGPDGLAIKVPAEYNMQKLIDNTNVCSYCKTVGKTVRIGFAGRCCQPCREKHVSRVEYKGWND